jgi:hypothetical protein
MPAIQTYKMRINGRSHTVTVKGNVTTYDPPLPQEDNEKFSERLADMIEAGRGPGAQTDTTFFANRGTLADQFQHDPKWLKMVCDNVRKRGGTVSDNAVYMQSLVRPGFADGDPDAMINPSEGVSKIKKVMEKRGIGCSDGPVKVKPRNDVDNDPIRTAKPLAQDIVNRLEKGYRKQGGEFAKMGKREITEYIRDKHSPKA